MNPLTRFAKPNLTSHFATRCRNILFGRLSEREDQAEKRKGRPTDFVDRFLEAQTKDPTISDGQLIGYVQANLIAGSDTTAVILRTAIYYTLRNPWIHKRLLAELDSHNLQFPVPYTVARNDLSFSAAIVREALRFHFPFMGMMERETPESGMSLPDGTFLPSKSVVGTYADIIGRDQRVFGADAETFNPLRWMQDAKESWEEFQSRLKNMTAAEIAFGSGPRSCIGKSVAELEIYKFLPTFFGLLEPRLVHPDQDWTVRELFVYKQSGMDMYLNWRPGRGLENLLEK